MSLQSTKWHLRGEEISNCNCAWGCPCQFNALPSHGHCQAFICWEIRDGAFGSVPLDGLRFGWIVDFPGAVHQGNGTRQLVVDERASKEQREALVALNSGKAGGSFFEIFTSVTAHERPPVFAPIDFAIDREARRGRIRLGTLGESRVEPILNPVTGKEHRARIALPNGFEYKEAEMGNAVSIDARAGGKLDFHHRNSYAALNTFDWASA